jgi:transketolase
MFDKVTKSIRVISAAAVEKANSGHPGMPMGMAEVGTVLFKNFLKVSNKQPDWINRDRFVLSAGHGSMLLYSLLHFNNFDISLEDIKQFRQLDSKTAGHPEVDTSLGIDITTGPLGQGFATGVGLALAESYLSEVLGKDIIDHYVYGIVSDGDLMEGISFEAAELAGVWKLGKLIYIFDDNNISIDGNVDKVSITDQKKKFESFGWQVLEVDGHNEIDIKNAIDSSKEETNKPSLIIAKSTIGKFAPNKQNTSSIHGAPLGNEEMKLFFNEIGWEGDSFDHSDDVYDYFAKKRLEDNKSFEKWKSNLDNKLKNDGSFKKLWEQFEKNELSFPESFEIQEAATRVTGGNYLKLIGLENKFVLGGSADLAASTKQIISEESYTSENRHGQNIEFGIREHSMAAVVNGISLHSNLFSFGSTFLVFSDYMRPSIRLASLMNLNSAYIFTHDSIYLGEDGPTHQPVEHLMSLRLIPGLDVIRPSNSIETIYAYKYLFSNTKNPKVLSLTRQNLKFLDYDVDYSDFLNGGFIISKGEDLTIFASGSEVNLALEIKETLKEYSVQVVSVPILNKLTPKISESLNSNKLTFTIELGKAAGWSDYIGNITESFSVQTFGKSAPENDLAEFFNVNAESIGKKIRNYLG